jgi:serine/threonine protein phosphatase PrpC
MHLFKVLSGSYKLHAQFNHVSAANIPYSKPYSPHGEDSYAISDPAHPYPALVVCDGVGGNLSAYTKQLSQYYADTMKTVIENRYENGLQQYIIKARNGDDSTNWPEANITFIFFLKTVLKDIQAARRALAQNTTVNPVIRTLMQHNSSSTLSFAYINDVGQCIACTFGDSALMVQGEQTYIKNAGGYYKPFQDAANLISVPIQLAFGDIVRSLPLSPLMSADSLTVAFNCYSKIMGKLERFYNAQPIPPTDILDSHLFHTLDVRPGDKIVMASDGLYDNLSLDTIQKCLNAYSDENDTSMAEWLAQHATAASMPRDETSDAHTRLFNWGNMPPYYLNMANYVETLYQHETAVPEENQYLLYALEREVRDNLYARKGKPDDITVVCARIE